MEPLRSAETPQIPYREAERDAIRQQLERLLANPLFKNSKRYPNLLRYVVERTLEGNPADLKERNLGVEVFGREPNYDTNADPIVRTTAGEIRKRIAQYYHEHGHESEIRIDLSPGSYVPEFEIPAAKPAPLPLTPLVALTPRRHSRLGYVTALATAAVLLIAAWFKPWISQAALDRFWGPVLDSSSTVLLGVGQRHFLGSSPETGPRGTADADIPVVGDPRSGSDAPITLFRLYYMGSQNVALSDVTTVASLTGLLRAKGKTYHLRGGKRHDFCRSSRRSHRSRRSL